MTFHDDEHKINNTGWIWNGDEREGWNEAKPKGNAERFFNLHFLDQKWSKDLEFALAKLRGLCKYLANVYNSHSHVYGLHRLTFVHENKAEKSMQWGESSFNPNSLWWVHMGISLKERQITEEPMKVKIWKKLLIHKHLV